MAETLPYLCRLLSTYGPSDPALRASLAPLLNKPKVQWCAGQVALGVATISEERQQAAGLINQGLLERLGHGSGNLEDQAQLMPYQHVDHNRYRTA